MSSSSEDGAVEGGVDRGDDEGDASEVLRSAPVLGGVEEELEAVAEGEETRCVCVFLGGGGREGGRVDGQSCVCVTCVQLTCTAFRKEAMWKKSCGSIKYR